MGGVQRVRSFREPRITKVPAQRQQLGLGLTRSVPHSFGGEQPRGGLDPRLLVSRSAHVHLSARPPTPRVRLCCSGPRKFRQWEIVSSARKCSAGVGGRGAEDTFVFQLPAGQVTMATCAVS